jgi:hypothetical protein
MNRMSLAIAALLLAPPALAGDLAAKTGAPAGKPRAPVTVTARTAPGSATVTVRFGSAASDVNIEVHGVDGLAVTTAASPVSGARFARGQTVTFDVGFTEGPGRSYLAVGVTGTFASGRRTAMSAVAVGKPTPEQLKQGPPAMTDSLGQRIKVLPSGK